MLAAAITAHSEVEPFAWGEDAELDAGCLLSGYTDVSAINATGRMCFQTTYLNDRYVEYFDHVGHYHLIWLVRNPYSVVYSMVYNWARFALDEVFEQCGIEHVADPSSIGRDVFGRPRLDPVIKASYAYLGKAKQALKLCEELPSHRFLLMEYESLVTDRAANLNRIFAFAGLAGGKQANNASNTMHAQSLKKAKKLSDAQRKTVADICGDTYERLLYITRCDAVEVR